MKCTWFAAIFIFVLSSWGGAGAEAAYWCEPLHAYYPSVRLCPSPWQTVDPQSGAQPLAIPPAQNAGAAQPMDGPQTQATGSTQNHQPIFPGRPSFVRGDELDEWCKGSTTALLTAICGNDQLRSAAIERLHAFNDAKSRLTPDRQKKLIDDQNEWALSYPTACGLNADVQPSLPLDPSLRDCLAGAGQARLQYLKGYGQTNPLTAATPATTSPPASPAPATPGPATPSSSGVSGPAGTQSPATAAPASPTPAASQNNATHQAATATIPSATQAQPAPSDTGPSAAPHGNSSLSKIGDFLRMGAMLIAILVVIIWAIAAWFQSRSRRTGKAAQTRR